jgi:hypothetical protein
MMAGFTQGREVQQFDAQLTLILDLYRIYPIIWV